MTTFFVNGVEYNENFGKNTSRVMNRAMMTADNIIVIDGDERYRLIKSRSIMGFMFPLLHNTTDDSLQSIVKTLAHNTNTLVVRIPKGYFYEGRPFISWLIHKDSSVVIHEYNEIKLEHILGGLLD